MPILTQNTQLPVFIKINKNCLNKLKKIIHKHNLVFNNPLIITNKHILEIAAKKIVKQFEKHTIHHAKENSLQEIDKIIKKTKNNNNDLIINIGGGKILDIGKFTATKLKINYINIPTAPSHDGIASSIAIIKNKKGITESLGVNMPLGILVDLNIIKNCPKKIIRAGVGDLLSNYSAIEDWKMADKETNEILNGFASNLALAGAEIIYANYKDKKSINIKSEKFIECLIRGLIMSGIAMSIAGSSRPCSGAEHEIAHAIEALHPNKHMHGEEVALGIILADKIRKNPHNFEKFFKKIALPISYKDLGLSKSQIIKIIQFAPKTRPDRYTILEKKKLTKKQIEKLLRSNFIDSHFKII